VRRVNFKKKWFFFLLFSIEILLNSTLFSQTKFFSPSDNVNKKRVLIASGLVSYVEIGSFSGLYYVWYAHSMNPKFNFFNDLGNWGNVDKYGHAYTTYQLSRTYANLYRWSGLSRKKSAIIGSAIGLGYQTTLEVFDGFSNNYGFSLGDMGFNLLGSFVFLGQELWLKEQVFLPKFSYHPTQYAVLRPNILGSNHFERFLKDYNGQTYWLSFSPGSIIKNTSFPNWLCLSVGYGVDARIVGDQTSYVSEDGSIYNSKQEFFLSLDIDLKKIPTKNKTLKRVLTSLNYLKIPAPAISVRGNQFKFYPIYF